MCSKHIRIPFFSLLFVTFLSWQPSVSSSLFLCQMFWQEGLGFAKLSKPPNSPFLKLTKTMEEKALQLFKMVGLCMKTTLISGMTGRKILVPKNMHMYILPNLMLNCVLCTKEKSPKRVTNRQTFFSSTTHCISLKLLSGTHTKSVASGF